MVKYINLLFNLTIKLFSTKKNLIELEGDSFGAKASFFCQFHLSQFM